MSTAAGAERNMVARIFSYARGKTVYAHRLVYEMTVGPIPKGLCIDHLCRNTVCCNPAHLEPVTNGENIRRGRKPGSHNRNKTHCSKGHPFDEANTGHRKTYCGVARHCKACSLAASRATKRKAKEMRK